MHIAKKTITFNQKETPGIDQSPGPNIEEGKTDYPSHRKEVGALTGLTPTLYDSGGRLPIIYDKDVSHFFTSLIVFIALHVDHFGTMFSVSDRLEIL